MEGGIVLDQVALGFDRHRLAGACNLKNQLQVDAHYRTDLEVPA